MNCDHNCLMIELNLLLKIKHLLWTCGKRVFIATEPCLLQWHVVVLVDQGNIVQLELTQTRHQVAHVEISHFQRTLQFHCLLLLIYIKWDAIALYVHCKVKVSYFIIRSKVTHLKHALHSARSRHRTSVSFARSYSGPQQVPCQCWIVSARLTCLKSHVIAK